jgi:hypothetical protein
VNLRAIVGLLSLLSLLAAEEEKTFTAMQKRWWAIQPLLSSVPPKMQEPGLKNEIDAFVAEKLAAKGLKMSPAADPATLLRRVSLDLTGLPPTPEELQSFLDNPSPQAYAQAVDRLLASPRYGERWARHWLDIARYADSDGFKADDTRPHLWRYRDYVIDSLNQDKPYNRFVKEQIAGDELYPNDPAARVGVSFHRHFPDEYNAAHIMLRRQEMLNDITDATASAFLGVTLGCARCHDHKFDPLLHKDYYRLQSFFANTRIDDGVVLDSAARQAEYDKQWTQWATATKAIRSEMDTLLEPRRVAFAKEHLERFPEDIQAVLTKKAEARNAYDWQIYYKAQPQLVTSDAALEGGLKGEAKTRYLALKAELKQFDNIKPAPLNIAQTMADASAQAPKTFVLRSGAWDAPMEEVQPGFLSILDPKPAQVVPTGNSTGRRTALANWLASETNPLSTRVIVNRVWHYHFGRGLVGTPSDFGVMGERPSHRELLDWLTAKFVGEDQWSLKKLHRRIVLSATYQQSSLHREEAAAVDPENKLLWHFQRRRLEGEAVRDSMLAVAGLLNTKMGGPGVFPPLPDGATVKGYALWKTTPEAADANRRSVYVFVRRNLRYPMFQSFDMPDTHESCARRQETVTPDQALELLNGRLIQEWSAAFAQRVANDQGLDTRAKAERALKIAFQRPATAKEIEMASQFLARQEKTAGSPGAALEDLCHTLLSSNEFLYIQ